MNEDEDFLAAGAGLDGIGEWSHVLPLFYLALL
jgi:hypothetical protein